MTPEERAWVEYDLWRANRIDALLRKQERLLDKLGEGTREQDEQIGVQIREVIAAIRELEKAKNPGTPPRH